MKSSKDYLSLMKTLQEKMEQNPQLENQDKRMMAFAGITRQFVDDTIDELDKIWQGHQWELTDATIPLIETRQQLWKSLADKAVEGGYEFHDTFLIAMEREFKLLYNKNSRKQILSPLSDEEWELFSSEQKKEIVSAFSGYAVKAFENNRILYQKELARARPHAKMSEMGRIEVEFFKIKNRYGSFVVDYGFNDERNARQPGADLPARKQTRKSTVQGHTMGKLSVKEQQKVLVARMMRDNIIKVMKRKRKQQVTGETEREYI